MPFLHFPVKDDPANLEEVFPKPPRCCALFPCSTGDRHARRPCALCTSSVLTPIPKGSTRVSSAVMNREERGGCCWSLAGWPCVCRWDCETICMSLMQLSHEYRFCLSLRRCGRGCIGSEEQYVYGKILWVWRMEWIKKKRKCKANRVTSTPVGGNSSLSFDKVTHPSVSQSTCQVNTSWLTGRSLSYSIS